MRARRAAKAALLLLLAAALVAGSSVLLRPMFSTSYGRNIETVRGIYHQPANSVQALFLGTSSMLSAVAPAQVYEETGIQSYNLATRSQPLIVSYYLLREAHRLNPDSLRAVVIDPVKLVDEEGTSAKAKESILLMRPSALKLEALLECSRYYDDFDLMENAVPAFGYHARWSELGEKDYAYLARGDASLGFSDHGYLESYGSMYEEAQQAGAWAAREGLTDARELEDADYEALFRDDRRYLDLIARYCADNGLDLLLVKLPRISWDDRSHDAIAYLAERYGVEFVDMNAGGPAAELGLEYELDYMDTKHANVRGSAKVTSYLAGLLERRLAGAPAPAGGAFPQADLDNRAREVANSRLFACGSLADYLGLVSDPAYAVFIATSEPDARIDSGLAARLKALGLDMLAGLGPGEYYCGVMSGGRGVRGLSSADPEAAFYRASFDGRGLVMGERRMQPGAVLDHPVSIQAGPGASIEVLGYDRCVKDSGLCMVVFDTRTGDLVDSSCFELKAPYNRLPHAIPAIPEGE